MANGGKRPGAGRKKKVITEARKNFAADILDDETERQKWDELLCATRTFYPSEDSGPVTEPDFRIRLDAMRWLCDQKHGKAPQTVEHLGEGGGAIKVIVEHIGRPSHSATA